MRTERADIYQQITTAIIEAIEAGCNKLKMPWHTAAVIPTNASTKRSYRGINVFALWVAAAKRGFRTNLWATYQQWHELGAQVRKGEKASVVVFWKIYGLEEQQVETNNGGDNEDEPRARCFARAYHVFNADQVDGFQIPEIPTLPEAERIERAELFFRRAGAKIVEKGQRAAYNVQADEIHMPPFSVFKKADYFYATLGHETVHFTGHASRCNRQLASRFGSESYAAEELIAEIGSAFLASELQLEIEPCTDHAPYVANWLQVLKNDKRAIFTAASHAQRALDWLCTRAAQEEVA
jgi:antirestriction protein ArdC